MFVSIDLESNDWHNLGKLQQHRDREFGAQGFQLLMNKFGNLTFRTPKIFPDRFGHR
jgi:hypothetical protein